MGPPALYLAGVGLAELVIEHHRARLGGRAQRITIDLDPTDDPTHGQQEFSFFNGHYDMWCYLPLVATLTFNAEPTQYLVAALLRPGQQPGPAGRAWAAAAPAPPSARGVPPGAPARPPRWRLCQPGGLGLPGGRGHRVRRGHGEQCALGQTQPPLDGPARILSRASGQTEHLYGETRYAARTWRRKRRVIIKAEVVRHPGRAPKNNPRFVITNLPDPPEAVYQVYCARGDMENRLKELHRGLALDRTSCHRFLANQFRVLLTVAAYILFQTLQAHAQGTACAGAQVSTLRERLFKLAARIERSVRRIVLHLPAGGGWLTTWRQIALRVGAAPA